MYFYYKQKFPLNLKNTERYFLAEHFIRGFFAAFW